MFALSGLDVEPATLAACERFTELQAFALDDETHLAFLREFSPDHPCTRAIERTFINQRRILYGLVSGLAVVGFAGATLFFVGQRRQAAVSPSLENHPIGNGIRGRPRESLLA